MSEREPEDMAKRIDDLEAALRRERERLASVRRRHEHELGAARRRSRSKEPSGVSKQVSRLERKLTNVYGSRTWKAGRLIWTVYHLPRLVAERFRRSREQIPIPPPVPAEPRHAVAAGRVDYSLVEDHVVRRKYEQAVARTGFTLEASRNVAIAVSTLDLDAGRGDLYTAVGIGRNLEALGWDVVYLARDRWYDVPRGADLYISMLAAVDLTQLATDLTKIAWIRNDTESWADQPSLGLYDLVLATSDASLERIQHHYAGPTELLPIGVDTELFRPGGRSEDRRGVVSTVNQWGREREVNSRLRSQPVEFPLTIFGHHRAMAPELLDYCRGPVSFFSLPSLYREAGVVLDDFNHTTAPYGNVNSRVVEAAACGAIVMTSRPGGLGTVALDSVPVYTSGPELHDLISTHLGNAESMKAAQARAQRIGDGHSYRRRAAQLATLVDGLPEPELGRGAALVIGYFPDYRDNPFTEMMWSALRNDRTVATPVLDSLDFSTVLRAVDHHQAVFHLNWTAPILGPARDPAARSRRHRRFLEALDELHDRGVPLVWTVHNVLPHECPDPHEEAQLRQEIADRVDLVHVMCEDTITACAGYYELAVEKVRVVPHPSFIDVYPNLVDRATARDELGLGSNEFVYLYLGKIRPYKGVDRLLEAFDRLAASDRSARLLLVGEPGRFEGRDQLIQQARANPAVVSNFNPIPDGDVQLFMNAADVVVLPYRNVLNSGALHLAYSFAKPVVAAAVGCIGHQVDETTGILFDWSDGDHALQAALQDARRLGPEHGRAAYARAAATHYLDVGRQFRELVAEVPRPRRP
jgi:glycosyltransferase involved in cell wall biosynthesis